MKTAPAREPECQDRDARCAHCRPGLSAAGKTLVPIRAFKNPHGGKWLSIRFVLCALLIAVALQMQGGGFAIAGEAHTDEASDTLYPGRYVANCKPARIVGCVYDTDSAGQISQLPQSTSEAGNQNRRIRDIEYLRMIEWLRLTCNAVAQSGRLR